MNGILKALAYGTALLLFTAFVAPKEAHAERPSTNNPYQYIAQMGQMGFTQGGAVLLPESLLMDMGQGEIAPIMQHALARNILLQCAEDAKKYRPHELEPFQIAQSKYRYGKCKMLACKNNAMLVLALPLLSDNEAAGGSDSGVNDQMATALAQGFQQEPSCAGTGPSIDPALIQLIFHLAQQG